MRIDLLSIVRRLFRRSDLVESAALDSSEPAEAPSRPPASRLPDAERAHVGEVLRTESEQQSAHREPLDAEDERAESCQSKPPRFFMKPGIERIVGKEIAHVIVKMGGRPSCQVFLIFTDDTHFELYSIDGVIHGASRVEPGGLETVRRYVSADSIVREA